jgi:histidine phosphotransferase ChpT
MPDIDLLLAELLATRLCHDIASPLNSVAAALEEMDGPAEHRAEALSLAQDAAGMLSRRLVLLRAAWGGGVEPLDGEGLREFARGLPGRTVTLDLADLAPDCVFAPDLARVLLNVLILAAEGLPRGGRVALGAAGAEAILCALDGPRAAWPPGLAAAIAAPEAIAEQVRTAEPRGLQAPLTVLVAAQAGFALSFLMGPGSEAAPPLLIRRAGG